MKTSPSRFPILLASSLLWGGFSSLAAQTSTPPPQNHPANASEKKPGDGKSADPKNAQPPPAAAKPNAANANQPSSPAANAAPPAAQPTGGTVPNISSAGTGGRDIAANFTAIDRNGDGQLSEAEYHAFMSSGKLAAGSGDDAGSENQAKPTPKSEKAAKGTRAGSPAAPNPGTDADAAAFGQLDTDHNGFISADEVAASTTRTP